MSGVSRTRPHPAAVAALAVVVWVVAIALLTSDPHGTGAREVGDAGGAALVARTGPCAVTSTNPGGTNNYRAGAPADADLGHGFVVTGVVRGPDCAPLPGVRVQVWAQTAEADEKHHRTSVTTAPDGTYRVESDPLEAQFGELNVHVAYDEGSTGPFRPVFLRNVVRRADTRAVVDLGLVAQ